jgi:hypothetical protein
MNYSAIYERLVQRARERTLEGYKERHHVVPRCLGGSDDPNNLVDLTGPEHAIAHMLLVKMHPGNLKLVFAANIMLVNANGIRYEMPRNKQYGWLKERAAKAMGDVQRGRVHSDEERKKRSESLKGRKPSPQTTEVNRERMTGSPGLRLGMTTSEDTRAKQSAAALARTDKEENDAKMRAGLAKKTPEERKAAAVRAWETRRKNGTDKFSDEQRAKMSASQQARTESPEEAHARANKAWETRRANGTNTYTDEQRARMAAAHVGKKQSPETVAKRIATRERNRALKAANLSDCAT